MRASSRRFILPNNWLQLCTAVETGREKLTDAPNRSRYIAVPTHSRRSPGYEFLPDHVAVNDMIPDIGQRYIPPDDALQLIETCPGLVPVAIDPTGQGRLYWADLGNRSFKEWQFLYTVKEAAKDDHIIAFSTDIRILESEAVVNDPVPVRGLIFHISRCGSTLLGKCLTSSSANVVINQGGPLQRGFWAWATNDFRRPLPVSPKYEIMFQRLVLAMTRRRRRGWRSAYIKFISWNALYIDFVRSAFPETPAMFMYRDPVEVIASVVDETSAALLAKGTEQARFLTGLSAEATADLSDARYLARCYRSYFQTALRSTDVALLNYRDLGPDSLAHILRNAFDLVPGPRQLDQMRRQFQFHSKDDAKRTAFVDDRATKQAALSRADRAAIRSELGSLMKSADTARTNLRHSMMEDVPC